MFHASQQSTSGTEFAVVLSPVDGFESRTTNCLSSSDRESFSSSQEVNSTDGSHSEQQDEGSFEQAGNSTSQQSGVTCSSPPQDSLNFVQAKGSSSFDMGTSAHMENRSTLPNFEETKMGRRRKQPNPRKKIIGVSNRCGFLEYQVSPSLKPPTDDSHSGQQDGETFEHTGASFFQSDDPCSSGTMIHLENDSGVLDLGECVPPIKKIKIESRCKRTVPSRDKTIRVSPTGRSNHPEQAINILNNWLMGHKKNPYPSEDDKKKLVEETGLKRLQISDWFINARRRRLSEEEKAALVVNRRQKKEKKDPTGSHVRLVENDASIASGSKMKSIPFMANSSESSLVVPLKQRGTKRTRGKENQDPVVASGSGSSLVSPLKQGIMRTSSKGNRDPCLASLHPNALQLKGKWTDFLYNLCTWVPDMSQLSLIGVHLIKDF